MESSPIWSVESWPGCGFHVASGDAALDESGIRPPSQLRDARATPRQGMTHVIIRRVERRFRHHCHTKRIKVWSECEDRFLLNTLNTRSATMTTTSTDHEKHHSQQLLATGRRCWLDTSLLHLMPWLDFDTVLQARAPQRSLGAKLSSHCSTWNQCSVRTRCKYLRHCSSSPASAYALMMQL